MALESEFNLVTVSIWISPNNIIDSFKIIKFVDNQEIEQLPDMTSKIDFREDSDNGGVQINVPVKLYTKLIILRAQ